MWCITLDRLLLVLLDIKYPLYCTERRAKCVVLVIWAVCIFASVLVWIVDVKFVAKSSMRVVYMVLSVSFLVFVVVAYSFIFWKFIRARNSPQHLSISSASAMGIKEYFRVCRGSRFFLSALLIVSYVVLYVVPTLLFHLHQIPITLRLMWFCLPLSYTVDALIYILSQPPIRKLCMLKLGFKRSERTAPIELSSAL